MGRGYLLFAHDAQLGQPLQVLCLGGLLRELLWTRPSRRPQGGLLLGPCHTNTGHGVTASPPSNCLDVRFFFADLVGFATKKKTNFAVGLPAAAMRSEPE